MFIHFISFMKVKFYLYFVMNYKKNTSVVPGNSCDTDVVDFEEVFS